MKRKPKSKLILRTETIRQLDGIELKRAAGGDPAIVLDTGAATCPSLPGAQTGACGGG